MKKIIILTCLLFACNLLFAEIIWEDVEKNDEGITACAACTTKKEVLEVTHWKDLDSHFIYYIQDKEVSEKDFYIVFFTNIGTLVYKYSKGTKTIAYYFKSFLD